MRKEIVELDVNGLWLRDVILHSNGDKDGSPTYDYPAYYTDTRPPTSIQPFYRPKWTGVEWVEDMSPIEIESLYAVSNPLTEIEQLRADNAALLLELVQTQARQDQAEQDQAALLLSLVEGGVL